MNVQLTPRKLVKLPTKVIKPNNINLYTTKPTNYMRKDKKTRHGKLTFILARQIGEAFVAGHIDEAELNRFLETL